MVAKSHDPEVWFFLKAVWCAVPKITWIALVEVVKELTNLPLPSPDSVRKKAKAENWTKNIRSYCQKSDKTLDNIKGRLFDELTKEYEKIQLDRDTLEGTKNGALIVKSGMTDFPNAVLEDIAYKNRTTLTVIKDTRRRFGKLGQLLDESIDLAYEAHNTLRMMYEDKDVSNEDLDRANQKNILTRDMAERLDLFSKTAQTIMKSEFLVFGINTDDTRDGDTSDRMESLQDDTVFDQARLDLENQYTEMQKQVAWIQSGNFQDEVTKEMEEELRKQQQEDALNDDDDEFDDDDI